MGPGHDPSAVVDDQLRVSLDGSDGSIGGILVETVFVGLVSR